MPSSDPPQPSDRAFVLLSGAAAVALRLAYLALGTRVPWPDTQTYLQAGQELLSGRPMTSTLVMPLYPLFVARVGWDATPVAQALLAGATVALVYALARRLFDSVAVARWAALLMAVEPLSVFYANQHMSETLFTLLLCGALWALVAGRPTLGALLLVLGILVRPSLDLLAPLLVAAFAWCEARRRGAAVPSATVLRRVAVYGLLYLLLMAPWWWHNAQKYGRFVRLNLGDGIVLRMEHNPVFVRDGFWHQFDFVSGEFADDADPVSRNDKRRAAAWAFIREDPLRYAALSLRRLGRYWSPVIDQSEGFIGRARWPFAAVTVVIYLGVPAFVRHAPRRWWMAIAPLLLVIGYLTALHTATNAIVRYRAPLMPLVVLIAAAGWQRATRRPIGGG